MKEEEDSEKTRDLKDDVKSESIAALRARAQQHSSKMMQVIHKGDKVNKIETTVNNTYDNSYMSERIDTSRHGIPR